MHDIQRSAIVWDYPQGQPKFGLGGIGLEQSLRLSRASLEVCAGMPLTAAHVLTAVCIGSIWFDTSLLELLQLNRDSHLLDRFKAVHRRSGVQATICSCHDCGRIRSHGTVRKAHQQGNPCRSCPLHFTMSPQIARAILAAAALFLTVARVPNAVAQQTSFSIPGTWQVE